MSFLRDYLTYASANEAPPQFHVWGGYMCLAAAVGRRIWFVADDGFLYPHLYVLYVGKAGNGKGEAMRKVKRVLAELGDVHLSGNVETPEGFIRYICGNPKATPPVESPVRQPMYGPLGVLEETTPITIFATEFVNFIAMNPEGWINLLNDIWDADVNYHYRTKGQGEDIVPGPSINILGALTTDVAADLQKQRIIGTGLSRRTIFQFGERQWNNPVARRKMTPERLEARTAAVEQLKVIRKVAGLMSNAPETDEWWDEWYGDNLRATPTKPLNVQSWYASKPDIVIKLAMLTAVSEGVRIMTIDHYALVLEYLEILEKDLTRIFGGVGRNELASVAQLILEHVQAQRDPIPEPVLKSTCFNSCKPPTEFEDCIQFLVSSGKLTKAMMTVNNVSSILIATPETMSAFGLAVKATQPAAVVQLLSPPGSTVVADLLGSLPKPHESSTVNVTQAELPHPVETSTSQLPKVDQSAPN